LLLKKIEGFKVKRGLLPPKNTPVEVKWQKVEHEWREAKKSGRPNRYEEFLDIFFDEVKSKRLSFGYMFLDKREYDKVESEFLENKTTISKTFSLCCIFSSFTTVL